MGFQDMDTAMQKCRWAFDSGQLKCSQKFIPYDVNGFLDLDMFLHQANETATLICGVISRYKTNKILANLTRRIKEHRKNAALISISVQLFQWLPLTQEISLALISSALLIGRAKHVEDNRFAIEQEETLHRLEQLLQSTSELV